ncbi:DEAD/DEAH box helicase [Streptomyces montanisoli]|uniref:Helicase associated domain protein n=1 Tax=Streptomyces montanisoli TaxID=2798581 RepID=A0A940RWS9_9ACTN|nr:DEAD/DEAH box helicase [Streptomyces montanisoli]MBP0460477.1 Helicase associated domain protein [Streptomyces montanisoli]
MDRKAAVVLGAGRKVLRPDQQAALDAGVKQLRRPGSRGLYVAATGTGKTLTSIRIAEALQVRLVLVVAPTLDLLAQTALAWRAEGHDEAMVIVSSMDASAHEGLAARGVGSTSDAGVIANLMASVGEGEGGLGVLTLLCSYDSLDKIEAAGRTGVPSFDLAIMDEAHRIAGRADKKWAVINDQARIAAYRRLYMTATPRAFGAPELAESAGLYRPAGISERAGESALDPMANSMSNERVYGKKFFDYPLAQAVADGTAADYRIVVPTVTGADLRALLNRPLRAGDGEGKQEAALRTTALHLAVLKTMAGRGLKRVLVFFNLIADAEAFTREMGQTLRLLRRTAPDSCPDVDPQAFYVHGDHTPQQRADIFDAFAACECAILTSAKVIGEGIDIPSVDAVAFADPTRSVVRCSQALGRALRLDVSGKIASLIVPAYVPPGADPQDILGTAYEPVWAIATALASHDHRILERLPDKANRLPREVSTLVKSRWSFDFTVRPERIARAMDLVAFDPRDTLSRPRREGLASAQAFHDTHGHLDVPTDHVDAYGYTLGQFITGMREAHRAGRLETDWRAELDALGMIWDKHDAAWRARLTTVADYHAAHGHLAAPATTRLGAFLAEQRSKAAHDRLEPARAADLAAIDPDWRLPYGPDWHRKYHLLRTHLAAGHALQPDTVAGGVPVGAWAHRQLVRFPQLHEHQQRMLAALGLAPAETSLTAPSRARRTFEETVQLLELFLHRHGRIPSAREDITVDGETVRLGPWFAKIRTRHRAGSLDKAQADLVASLFDGDWTSSDPQPSAFTRSS